jgi:tRNA-2-methylthio-N6-dimethylallyladenosine synthase
MILPRIAFSAVLFDRKGKREGQLIGRSPFNQSVFAEANERLIDTMVNVTLTEGFENSMTGTIDTVEEVLQKA